MAVFKKVEDPLRMVFLGCGSITRKHAEILKGFGGVHLYYASREETKAKQFSTDLKGAGYFGAYSAAILSPDIDVVFIATPPDSHLQLAVEAMKAGKHVIVEKPPFFSSADFDVIDQLRQQHHTQLLVAENYFYKPVLQSLRRALSGNHIGDIKFLFFNATKTQEVKGWRGDEATVGGGALFEGGIHWINFMSNLGLTVKSVAGFKPGTTSNKPTMELSMQVVAEYEEGAVGTLLYSWEVNALFKGLRLSRIYGTRGSITFESNGLFIFVRGDKWTLIFPGLSNIGGTKLMFRDFFHALRNGEEAQFSFTKAKNDLRLIEEAYKTVGR
ncbi:MAG: Gfo/Idh/MocA family oxidoreductase [Ferruginibacter sp.]|nr:Gfo/Idh/MocA family oxidoreductase [Ferruginibacter sp.]